MVIVILIIFIIELNFAYDNSISKVELINVPWIAQS